MFIFLSDLCLKIAYFQVSKFAHLQIREIFFLFIIVRPAMILLYHVFEISMTVHKKWYFNRLEKQ